MKVQTKEESVPSCNQPDCRTVEGSGDNLRKQGNEVAAIGAPDNDRGWKPYNTGDNNVDAGKGTTNKGDGGGMKTQSQGFTAGSGVPPSRIGDV